MNMTPICEPKCASRYSPKSYTMAKGNPYCDECGGLLIPDIALAVRQPWAWAIVAGFKDIENRTTFAITRGDIVKKRIAIYSSQSMTQKEYDFAADYMLHRGVFAPLPKDLAFGSIIGVTTVAGVVNDHSSEWFMGPRGLILEDSIQIEPIRATGNLGYYRWNRSDKPVIDPKRWMIKYSEPQQPKKERLI